MSTNSIRSVEIGTGAGATASIVLGPFAEGDMLEAIVLGYSLPNAGPTYALLSVAVGESAAASVLASGVPALPQLILGANSVFGQGMVIGMGAAADTAYGEVTLRLFHAVSADRPYVAIALSSARAGGLHVNAAAVVREKGGVTQFSSLVSKETVNSIPAVGTVPVAIEPQSRVERANFGTSNKPGLLGTVPNKPHIPIV